MIEPSLRGILQDLEVVVAHKSNRNWLVASCPFAEFGYHEFGTDANPSFTVKIDPAGYSGYNCFTCHQHGSLLRLIQKLGVLRGEDYTALEARAIFEETPDSFVDWDDDGVLEELEMSSLDSDLYLSMYPLAWESPESRRYLKSRGISKAAVEELDLRFHPESKRVLWPVYGWTDDSGKKKLYGFSGRSILSREWTHLYPKVKDYGGLKKERVILGEQLVEKYMEMPGACIFLIEGLMAQASLVTIGCLKIGIPAATLGSYLSPYQASLLISYGLPVYLMYDDDVAGDQGLYGPWNKREEKFEGGGAIDKLKGEVPLYLCTWPERTGDPDEITIEELEKMKKEAKQL